MQKTVSFSPVSRRFLHFLYDTMEPPNLQGGGGLFLPSSLLAGFPEKRADFFGGSARENCQPINLFGLSFPFINAAERAAGNSTAAPGGAAVLAAGMRGAGAGITGPSRWRDGGRSRPCPAVRRHSPPGRPWSGRTTGGNTGPC